MHHEQEMCSPAEHETRTPPPGVEAPQSPTPATRHEQKLLDRLHTEHGDAFQIYLDHYWRGTPIVGMEDDFRSLYWGSYDKAEQFADDLIDAFGWADARTELVRTWAIPSDVLTWNHAAFLTRLASDYDFRVEGGQTHVFIK